MSKLSRLPLSVGIGSAPASREAPHAATRTEPRTGQRHGLLVAALLAAVVVADQAAKWWAWRHVPHAQINAGGDVLTGPFIGKWYAARFTGALLDLADFGLLSVAVTALARWRAPASIVASGALMAGGWGSNLLDRLGMHYWTAPGSVRGAVDFIHISTYMYNVADFYIIGCTPLFLVAAGCYAVRAARRGRLPGPFRGFPRVQAWVPALAGAGLVLAVGLGAVNYGGVRMNPLSRTVLVRADAFAPVKGKVCESAVWSHLVGRKNP